MRGKNFFEAAQAFEDAFEKCEILNHAMLSASAGVAPARTQQEGKDMAKGMNANELQELKETLLKAERLELLAIAKDAESLQEVIQALEQRLKA